MWVWGGVSVCVSVLVRDFCVTMGRERGEGGEKR